MNFGSDYKVISPCNKPVTVFAVSKVWNNRVIFSFLTSHFVKNTLNWARRTSNSKLLLKNKKLGVENTQRLNKRIHIILKDSKSGSVSFRVGDRKLNVCFHSKIISCKCRTSQNHRKVICSKGREWKNMIQWKEKHLQERGVRKSWKDAVLGQNSCECWESREVA